MWAAEAQPRPRRRPLEPRMCVVCVDCRAAPVGQGGFSTARKRLIHWRSSSFISGTLGGTIEKGGAVAFLHLTYLPPLVYPVRVRTRDRKVPGSNPIPSKGRPQGRSPAAVDTAQLWSGGVSHGLPPGRGRATRLQSRPSVKNPYSVLRTWGRRFRLEAKNLSLAVRGGEEPIDFEPNCGLKP